MIAPPAVTFRLRAASLRAAGDHTRAAHFDAVAELAEAKDAAGRYLLSLTPAIGSALRALGIEPGQGPTDTAWSAACAVAGRIERGDLDGAHEVRGAQGFCLALLAHDVPRASELAAWITDPGAAMSAALARVQAQRAGAAA